MTKKYFWHCIVLVLLAYLATRLVNLTIIPIFTDEAIYIRWGQIGLRDASNRFLSLEDGKQPLFVWLMYPMLKIFSDPLIAGRMVSVTAGLGSLIGIMVLAKMLFGKKTVIPTGLLYVTCPFFLLYDRLGIYDSLINMFAIWSLICEVWLVTTLRLDAALLLGFAIGGGLLTKSPAQFFLHLLPVSLLLFDWKKTNRINRLAKWCGLAILGSTIAIAFSFIIKLSPLQHMVNLKNHTFIVPVGDFIKDPFSRLWGNLHGLTDWLVGYLTWPWVIGISVSIVLACKHHFRKTVLLLAWWLFPFTVLAAFGIVLYPRFILFMTFPLLIILAYGVSQLGQLEIKSIRSIWVRVTCCVLLFAYSAYVSSQLLFNPVNATIPKADRLQFMDDWPAGYGIPEVIKFLKQEAQKGPVFVGTEGTFGLTPYALTIYLQGYPNLDIKGYWPISSGVPEIEAIAKTKTTYILFKDTQEPNPEWPLTLVMQFRKGRGNVFMKLYRVTTR